MPMNPESFRKMAIGDTAGLMELAVEYFTETRRLMSGWAALLESQNYAQLRDELHRCKGGASLFGLERLVSILGECERPSHLENRGFDVGTFGLELSAAEAAVAGMAETVC